MFLEKWFIGTPSSRFHYSHAFD